MTNTNDPFDPELVAALADDPVPALSGDFADRVVAASETRAPPLPRTRAPGKGSARWRTARRLVIGVAAAGALGTAAAASGLLEELGVDLPSPEEVWSAVTGQDVEPAPPSAPAPAPLQEPDATTVIEGPIDTPEELEEAFRRVDEVRDTRRSNRRERVDDRIDGVLERRRAQGLSAPTPEKEARLRERLDDFRERNDARVEARTETRREELREELDENGSVSPEDIIRSGERDGPTADRIERFRNLTPEERRERMQQWRERRQERVREGQSGGAEQAPTQEAAPIEEPPSDPPQ